MDILKRDSDRDRRGRKLKDGIRGQGPVVCLLTRDLRAQDNWTLLWAQQEAILHQKSLLVVLCCAAGFAALSQRQAAFMHGGLHVTRKKLEALHIPVLLFSGEKNTQLLDFLLHLDTHLLVSDLNPLKEHRRWKNKLYDQLQQPVYEVDSHNIIPIWVVSDKKEWAAYTLRPKINRLVDDYLTDIPQLESHPFPWGGGDPFDQFDNSSASGMSDRTRIKLQPGEDQAMDAAKGFTKNSLAGYEEHRNNPCMQGQSGLSPYLHFGQLAPQRLAFMVNRSSISKEGKQVFLEELIVRRELADNFCYYEPDYDSFAAFPEWAKKTLDEHRGDKREYLYSFEAFEQGLTHERLWNACQNDLVRNGKLHGFLRMYWGKKILEWTADPETALQVAITLNDRYSLDGRDPNGYTGIAWSIGGVHDRAWKERPVFGKVRYMNAAGCRRKFDTELYIQRVTDLAAESSGIVEV